MPDQDLFDENGNIKPSIHKEHHIYIHARKTREDKREEMMSKIVTSLVTSLVIGGVMTLFGVIWWAFVQFVKSGGQA